MLPPEPLIDQASHLGCELNADQADRLESYVGLLVKWNQVHNLTAIRNPVDMRVQHLLDCLAVVAPLRRQLGDLSARVLDVGSGAGLPGVVLAVAMPELQVTCVDAVAKKAAFVTQVAAELGLKNLRAEHARVEQLRLPSFDVVTSRALGSLRDLVRLTRPLLKLGGVWMAMKGIHPAEEIAELAQEAQMFHVEPLHIPALQGERCLVWMR
jgi:16S rRNA (guanine527-N7)-methyltransferase